MHWQEKIMLVIASVSVQQAQGTPERLLAATYSFNDKRKLNFGKSSFLFY